MSDEFNDCGADQISGFLMDSLEVTGLIKSIVVSPPTPWIWDLDGSTAYAKLFYSVEFREIPIDCPPYNDPILDSAVVRRELDSLLARGNAFNPTQSLRTESVAFVNRNPDGSLRISYPTNPTSTLCNSRFSLTVNDPTLVAVLHSHPFTAGEVTPCGDNPPNPYAPDAQGGASLGDYFKDMLNNGLRAVAQLPPYRTYVIDHDRIWAPVPLVFPDDGSATVKKWPRVDAGCVRR